MKNLWLCGINIQGSKYYRYGQILGALLILFYSAGNGFAQTADVSSLLTTFAQPVVDNVSTIVGQYVCYIMCVVGIVYGIGLVMGGKNIVSGVITVIAALLVGATGIAIKGGISASGN